MGGITGLVGNKMSVIRDINNSENKLHLNLIDYPILDVIIG